MNKKTYMIVLRDALEMMQLEHDLTAIQLQVMYEFFKSEFQRTNLYLSDADMGNMTDMITRFQRYQDDYRFHSGLSFIQMVFID